MRRRRRGKKKKKKVAAKPIQMYEVKNEKVVIYHRVGEAAASMRSAWDGQRAVESLQIVEVEEIAGPTSTSSRFSGKPVCGKQAAGLWFWFGTVGAFGPMGYRGKGPTFPVCHVTSTLSPYARTCYFFSFSPPYYYYYTSIVLAPFSYLKK